MLEKMEKEGRLEQEQEAMLYLLVVELRQDWRAARDLLAGPLGQILENSPSCYLRCISKVSMFLKTPMHSFMILRKPFFSTSETVSCFIVLFRNVKGR
jgi:hypothetical protein